MKSISVILPTYNSEETLETALNSLAGQTYKNIEVLIIDGLSLDNTIKIAESFKDSIDKLKIVSEKDKGVYDAMNKGIDLAQGEWLYFMGSDDSLYEPNTMEDIAKSDAFYTGNVIYGNVKINGETGWAKDGDIYDGAFCKEKIINQNICHQAIVYNAKFIKEKIGYFNLDYTICSDWDFNLRCWSKTNFLYIDIVIAKFFSGGLSSNAHDELLAIDFVNNILKYFKIGLFSKLINSPNFKRYSEVKMLQKSIHPYRFKLNNSLNVFLKWFKI